MSRFNNPPTVEPLGDLSWRRIEQGVFTALAQDEQGRLSAAPSRRRWLLAGSSLALAAAAVVAAFVLVGDEDPPRSAAVSATAPGPDGTKSAAIRTSRFVTQGDSTAISLVDSSLVLHPDSALVVNESDSETQLVLERGTVSCAVQPRASDRPFVVMAGGVRVQVVGTKFSVERTGDLARVVVERGRVLVFAEGQRFELGAGDCWPQVKVAGSKGRKARKVAHRRTPTLEEKPQSAKEIYRQAAALESSDPAAAVGLYRELERRGGSWAKTALFARARLELERGNRGKAKQLLDRYLDLYPTAINATDAQALRRQLR